MSENSVTEQVRSSFNDWKFSHCTRTLLCSTMTKEYPHSFDGFFIESGTKYSVDTMKNFTYQLQYIPCHTSVSFPQFFHTLERKPLCHCWSLMFYQYYSKRVDTLCPGAKSMSSLHIFPPIPSCCNASLPGSLLIIARRYAKYQCHIQPWLLVSVSDREINFSPISVGLRKPTALGLKHFFFRKTKTKQKWKTKTKLKFIFNFNIFFIIHLQNEKRSIPSAVGFRSWSAFTLSCSQSSLQRLWTIMLPVF